MESKTHISVRDLNVYYGDNHVLKNVNVDIPDKKITAIIGPSGCGKTTLLKCFNRLIDIVDDVKVTGKVFVDGENIFDPGVEITQVRKKMGLLSQRPYPLPMSIYDNVAFGPKLHGIKKKKDLDKIVEHYLNEANLWDEVKDRLKLPASRLSIGQQQRLCLARGLAVEPEIILGDEPTSALDPQSSQHIEKNFLKLKDKYTIVFVTHILRQAKRIADYIVFIHMGEVIEHGPASEILENPKEQKTKEYISGVIS
jgi:phosphate transport system ATP-binding protein